MCQNLHMRAIYAQSSIKSAIIPKHKRELGIFWTVLHSLMFHYTSIKPKFYHLRQRATLLNSSQPADNCVSPNLYVGCIRIMHQHRLCVIPPTYPLWKETLRNNECFKQFRYNRGVSDEGSQRRGMAAFQTR